MKASIHLFYGIIIGVLICACTGGTSDTATPTSIKTDKAEFKVEKIVYGGTYRDEANRKIKELKGQGWTILDAEIYVQVPEGSQHYDIYVGK